VIATVTLLCWQYLIFNQLLIMSEPSFRKEITPAASPDDASALTKPQGLTAPLLWRVG
jgi:hypothetical protein